MEPLPEPRWDLLGRPAPWQGETPNDPDEGEHTFVIRLDPQASDKESHTSGSACAAGLGHRAG